MRFRLRTLLLIAALGPPLLAGLWSIAYLGWAWSQGVIGTDNAVQYEMERARTTTPFDPDIHAYPGETFDEWEERMKKTKGRSNAPPDEAASNPATHDP